MPQQAVKTLFTGSDHRERCIGRFDGQADRQLSCGMLGKGTADDGLVGQRCAVDPLPDVVFVVGRTLQAIQQFVLLDAVPISVIEILDRADCW
ncbi:hypothetical protein D3C84_1082180 [compost metagenome]